MQPPRPAPALRRRGCPGAPCGPPGNIHKRIADTLCQRAKGGCIMPPAFPPRGVAALWFVTLYRGRIPGARLAAVAGLYWPCPRPAARRARVVSVALPIAARPCRAAARICFMSSCGGMLCRAALALARPAAPDVSRAAHWRQYVFQGPAPAPHIGGPRPVVSRVFTQHRFSRFTPTTSRRFPAARARAPFKRAAFPGPRFL